MTLNPAHLLQHSSDAALARCIASTPAGTAHGAEAELCRRLAPRIRLYALKHLRDEQAAADLVQESLLVTLERLRAGEVREPERLGSFVLGICRMLVLDRRRGAERRQRLLESYARDLAPAHAPTEPWDAERLAECLQRLAERERTVLVLTFYVERPAEAIAGELGLSAANVRVIRHRAVGRLRECLTRTEVTR